MSASLLRKRAHVETETVLSASQTAPALLATNEPFPGHLVETAEKRIAKTGTTAVPHVTRNAAPAESEDTTVIGLLHDSKLRDSTVLEHHPSVDTVHDDERILCSV